MNLDQAIKFITDNNYSFLDSLRGQVQDLERDIDELKEQLVIKQSKLDVLKADIEYIECSKTDNTKYEDAMEIIIKAQKEVERLQNSIDSGLHKNVTKAKEQLEAFKFKLLGV